MIVETTQCVWSFTVLDVENQVVEVQGNEPNFNGRPPVRGQLTEAVEPVQGGRSVKGYLVKGWPFVLTFANVVMVCNPVVTARVEGDGWHYEAIE